MNVMMKFTLRNLRWFCCGVGLLVLAACAGPGGGSRAPAEMMGVSIVSVGHIGGMVGIPDFYVNGSWGGNSTGWGGGGKTTCCVSLPKIPQPTLVTVKWKTCDISHIKFVNDRAVDPNLKCKSEWHEASVPVHFTVPAGKSFGLNIHFLPGNKVEAWLSNKGLGEADYPGPKYSSGPAPDYAVE
ncbi:MULTISPECIES: DUF3304 domain-containing protein [unclassified Janthinobacterium]|uniref:DUF3304 domain-containing protein n=1 Tax=unclassified Janthinobacterium TaxID=2610881 RepID=UPI0009D99243|nr:MULTISPECIES: DUF3304 domain-containing protein [unclassified Janthinobacterium]MEC5159138.1 hypothetical protein [Janthinobacterium sp. CG_S6]